MDVLAAVIRDEACTRVFRCVIHLLRKTACLQLEGTVSSGIQRLLAWVFTLHSIAAAAVDYILGTKSEKVSGILEKLRSIGWFSITRISHYILGKKDRKMSFLRDFLLNREVLSLIVLPVDPLTISGCPWSTIQLTL
jgi:hypothetical protein